MISVTLVKNLSVFWRFMVCIQYYTSLLRFIRSIGKTVFHNETFKPFASTMNLFTISKDNICAKINNLNSSASYLWYSSYLWEAIMNFTSRATWMCSLSYWAITRPVGSFTNVMILWISLLPLCFAVGVTGAVYPSRQRSQRHRYRSRVKMNAALS